MGRRMRRQRRPQRGFQRHVFNAPLDRPHAVRRLWFESLEDRRVLATFVVNSTGDEPDSFADDGICDTANNPLADPAVPPSGICTLRAAVDQASFQASNDRIEFDIDVAEGVIPRIETIATVIGINGTLTVDGSTQEAGMVEVHRPSSNVITLAGEGGHTIRGLIITGGSTGISILSHGNTIVGNIIGLDRNGAVDGSSSAGMSIVGSNNQIGGLSPVDRNVISGNQAAIRIQSSGELASNNNVITGNFFGTDATGATIDPDDVADSGDELGNVEGIVILSGDGTVIGGGSEGAGNVFAGHERAAIDLNGPFGDGESIQNTLIEGNFIGTDSTGSVALGNEGRGVEISAAVQTTIRNNVIAASFSGVHLGSNVSDTIVVGNKIGTDATGLITDPDGFPGTGDEFGNAEFGVLMRPFFAGTTNTGNRVGGPQTEDRNIISGNTVGIRLFDGADNQIIEGNFIGVGSDGSTPLPNGKGVEILFASQSIVASNTISGNGTGVEIAGSTATDNLIVDNRIGVQGFVGSTLPGDLPVPNQIGILINDAPGNCIGGVYPVAPTASLNCEIPEGATLLGNVISANSTYGVKIVNGNAASNLVRGNFIGTDRTGQITDPDGNPGTGDELGNGFDGVSLEAGAHDNTIGGTLPAARNIISGNLGDGILIVGASGQNTRDNHVVGNHIGTNATGDQPLPNHFRGVHIDQHTTGNVIGGATPAARNLISGNQLDGVVIALPTAVENRVLGNLIGVAADGETRLGNRGNGVFLFDAPENEIGGLATGEGNVISANEQAGVLVQSSEARENLIAGNLIGTNASGHVVDPDGELDSGDELGNLVGVIIDNAPANRVGGPVSAEGTPGRNVIVGNSDGVFIAGPSATGNLVGGNLIGMDLANNPGSLTATGVTLFGASGNFIGGIAPDGERLPGNVISRNDIGVQIFNDGETPATQNVVSGNFIGTDVTGDPLPVGVFGNLTAGVSIVDAAGNFIGQDTGADVACNPDEFAPGNIIAGNFGPGVAIEGETATGNIIRCNSIYANDNIGIDLDNDGVTLNDPLDADGSPNDLQNYPIISIYERIEDNLRIAGSLQSQPDTPYRIDFYATDTQNVDKMAHAIQGQRHIGSTVVTTDSTGFVNFRTDNFALDPISVTEVVTATATDAQGNTSEFGNYTPDFFNLGTSYRTPVIFVPGFFASFTPSRPGVVNDGDYATFLTTLGIHPTALVPDPIGKGYNDLIQTLQTAGYVEGEDLFVATYDWRLSLAPSGSSTTKDGIIEGVTAEQISDETFEYGIDYIGYWLRQAAEAWYVKHQVPLTSVHIIAHSMGGLLSRTYIQSSAYGDTFQSDVRTDGGKLALPAVANLTMLAVPNRGAAVTFPTWDDNFAGETSYRLVLSKVVNHAWQKLKAGHTIQGGINTIEPGDYDFDAEDIDAEKRRFVREYVKGMGDLLPEYEGFAANFDPESEPEFTNWLLEDLNHTARSSDRVARSISRYGTNVETHTFVNQNVGSNWLFTPTLASFTDYRLWVAGWSQTWYSDTDVDANGDGTVPLQSLETLFMTGEEVDERVELYPYCSEACRPGDRLTTGNVNHTSLPSNVDVQLAVLRDLGHPLDPSRISTGSEVGTAGGLFGVAYPFLLVSLYVDPVGALIVDRNGNRLGYIPGTGPVTEIPGSIYIGGEDGFGLIFDHDVDVPLELRLTGLGETYSVQAMTLFGGYTDGVDDTGFLALGETKTIPIPIAARPKRQPAVVFAGDAGQPPLVRVIDTLGTETEFMAFDPGFLGGVRVAAGDVNGDGFADIVTGTGAGAETKVRTFSGVNGGVIHDFTPFSGFTGGVNVAVADVNGDGVDDIVTGAGSGGAPQVKVFDGLSGNELFQFLAYDPNFPGGVFVAAGDVDGDGVADVITGAGPGGGPHVKVFNSTSQEELLSFFAYEPTFTGGVRVAAGHLNDDDVADIVTGAGPGGPPQVAVFDGQDATEMDRFLAYDSGFDGGVFVATSSVHGQGTTVVTSPGEGQLEEREVKAFDGLTREPTGLVATIPSDNSVGITVGGALLSPATIVNLPPEGGPFTAFIDGDDLVVVQDNNEELLRESKLRADRIRINGTPEGNDQLIVNLDDFRTSLYFDGGAAGNDSLVIDGSATFQDVHYDFENEHDGEISLTNETSNELRIFFTGLEPILDQLNVVDRAFTFPQTDDVIALNTGADADDNLLRIDSDHSELVDFTPPSGSLTVLFGDGTDQLTIDLLVLPKIDGTNGHNSIILAGSNHDIDWTQMPADQVKNISAIDLRGDGNNRLTLNAAAVTAISPNQTLTVQSDRAGAVRFESGWLLTAIDLVDGNALHVLEKDNATLRLDGPAKWQNPADPFDVTNDQVVNVLDLVAIMTGMRANGVGYLPEGQPSIGSRFVDVTGDLRVNILDATGVVTAVRRRLSGDGEPTDSDEETIQLLATDQSRYYYPTPFEDDEE